MKCKQTKKMIHQKQNWSERWIIWTTQMHSKKYTSPFQTFMYFLFCFAATPSPTSFTYTKQQRHFYRLGSRMVFKNWPSTYILLFLASPFKECHLLFLMDSRLDSNFKKYDKHTHK